MKKLKLSIVLMTACCTISSIQLYAQGVIEIKDTTRNFCFTSAEVKYYQTQAELAKERAAEIYLKDQIIQTDSVSDAMLNLQNYELGKQLTAKDTLISLEKQENAIGYGDLKRVTRGKNIFEGGFFASIGAFIATLIYKERK